METRNNDTSPSQFNWDEKNKRFIPSDHEVEEELFDGASVLVSAVSRFYLVHESSIVGIKNGVSPRDLMRPHASFCHIISSNFPEVLSQVVGKFLGISLPQVKACLKFHAEHMVRDNGFYGHKFLQIEQQFKHDFQRSIKPIRVVMTELTESYTIEEDISGISKDQKIPFELFIEILFSVIEMELHIPKSVLRSKSRKREIVQTRFTFFHICKSYYGEEISWSQLSHCLMKDHATAIRACREHCNLYTGKGPICGEYRKNYNKVIRRHLKEIKLNDDFIQKSLSHFLKVLDVLSTKDDIRRFKEHLIDSIEDKMFLSVGKVKRLLSELNIELPKNTQIS